MFKNTLSQPQPDRSSYFHKPLLNDLINDKAVCRTDSATPGLLTMSERFQNQDIDQGSIME